MSNKKKAAQVTLDPRVQELIPLLRSWNKHERSKCFTFVSSWMVEVAEERSHGIDLSSIAREDWLWLQHAIQRAIALHDWASILKHSQEKGYQAFVYIQHAIPSGIGEHAQEPAIALLKAYTDALEVEAAAEAQEEVEVSA